MDDAVNETDLGAVRLKIDRVDRQLVRMLAARKSLVETAARIKRYPRYVVDADRNDAVQENVRRCAREFGLPEAFAGRVWRFLTELWIRHQLDLMVRESGEVPYAGNETAAPARTPKQRAAEAGTDGSEQRHDLTAVRASAGQPGRP